VGGAFRLVFAHPESKEPMAFFGRYLEVIPHARISWTNEEADGPGPVTTVTFEEKGSKTEVVLRDLYPSKEALEAAVASGSTSGTGETFQQLEALLVELG
jgi:uncharacterized protein YndB with AHSA1/START domain